MDEGARTAGIIEGLCAWFGREARDLPWRRRRTGYTALVAEAMLQQTQVARVVERYEDFLRRFPTVRALGEAGEQEVLALWRGMGYYRRARSLHEAARVIERDFGGRVPRTAGELRSLPGVGRYTAGSIASIVYGKREPVVDGNVERVLARLEGRRGAHQAPQLLRWAWGRAGRLVEEAKEPGVLNEALMELGAVVCTPRRPRCGACPVAELCEARRVGAQEKIPRPKRAPRRRRVHHHAVVMVRGDKVMVEQRPPGGMWAGMWQVPTVETARRLSAAALRKRVPRGISGIVEVGEFEHGTTHRLITFHVLKGEGTGRNGVWRAIGEMDDLPMSNAQRRVLEVALGPYDAAPNASSAASGRLMGTKNSAG